MKRSIGLLSVLVLSGTTALAQAAGQDAGDNARQQGKKDENTRTVTVSGCLSVNPARRPGCTC